MTPAQIAAGLEASYALRDTGIPAEGIKPTTFTAAPSLHVRVIGEAILSLLPKVRDES